MCFEDATGQLFLSRWLLKLLLNCSSGSGFEAGCYDEDDGMSLKTARLRVNWMLRAMFVM